MIHTITVIHWRDRAQHPGAVFVGRPSPLGNPYKLARNASDAERAACIAQYSEWLDSKLADISTDEAYMFAQLRNRVQEGPLTLVCWCAPKACHADIIAERLRTSLDDQPHATATTDGE